MSRWIAIMMALFYVSLCEAQSVVDGVPESPDLMDIIITEYDFEPEHPEYTGCYVNAVLRAKGADGIIVAVDRDSNGWTDYYIDTDIVRSDTLQAYTIDCYWMGPFDQIWFYAANKHGWSDMTAKSTILDFIRNETVKDAVISVASIFSPMAEADNVRVSDGSIVVDLPGIEGLVLSNLAGQVVASCCNNTLRLPNMAKKPVYILTIRRKNKSFSKKIQL